MNKTLLIGLDGATFSILDILMKDGTMPFLKQFVARGTRSELLSTPHPLTPPAFTSMATGRGPGNHGIYDFVRSHEQGGKIFFTLYDSRDIMCETLWSIVSRQGGTVGVINYIMTSPPKPINGYSVPGMVHWRHLKRNIHPVGLYEKLKDLPGFDPKKLAWDFRQEEKAVLRMPQEEYVEWVMHHIERERQWFYITRYLMQEHPTDLMAVVFDGLDKIQHICWEFIDPRAATGNLSDWDKRMRKLCLGYFRELDGFLREIVGLAGEEAAVFMVSDHGFGPTHSKFHVNQFLANLGYLKWKDGYSAGVDNVARERETIELDWEKTIAHARTRSNNGIYIRVAKFPGQTGIAPEKYHSFREQLTKQFLDLKDPVTGKPIVKMVLTREEAFPGHLVDDAPDLTLILHDYGLISIAKQEPMVESLERVVGTHYPEGIFIAAGPHIRRGMAVNQLSLLDVSSTLLYSLGLPVPEDFEGKVPVLIFDEEYAAAHPVVTGPQTNTVQEYKDDTHEKTGDVRTEQEKQEIYSHLKALGYMD